MYIYALLDWNDHWSVYQVHPEAVPVITNLRAEQEALAAAEEVAKMNRPSRIVRIVDTHSKVETVAAFD